MADFAAVETESTRTAHVTRIKPKKPQQHRHKTNPTKVDNKFPAHRVTPHQLPYTLEQLHKTNLNHILHLEQHLLVIPQVDLLCHERKCLTPPRNRRGGMIRKYNHECGQKRDKYNNMEEAERGNYKGTWFYSVCFTLAVNL